MSNNSRQREGPPPGGVAATATGPSRPRVVLARDAKCLQPEGRLDPAAVRGCLDSAMVHLTGKAPARRAWAALFGPKDRVAIKVNTLGHHTHPVVAEAIARSLVDAGLPPKNVLVWDRSSAELRRAGFQIVTDGEAPRCFGTDSVRAADTRVGYEADVATSGQIGSRYSAIVSRLATALVSAPVLKDHSLAGLSGGLKNFFGAIHNPNKYHDRNCDPYIADVVAHPWIRRKLRLVVVDATYAQYHGGPSRRGDHLWPLGALLVGTDPVAVDAVAADMLDRRRREAGLGDLASEGRPASHVLTAAARGLGVADLKRIQLVEV